MKKNNKRKLTCLLSVSLCLCGEFLLQGCANTNATSTTAADKPTLTSSDSPYDMAIDGEGFFIVETGQGGYLFTRHGNFTIDSNRYLVTNDGYKLAPPIQVPDSAGDYNVTLDGKILFLPHLAMTVTPVGNIRVAVFANPRKLERDGNYFLPTAASGDPVTETPGSNGAGTIKIRFIEK